MPCALLLLAPVSLSLSKHQLTKGDWAGYTNSFQGHVTAITLRCSAHIRLGRMPGNAIKVTRQDYSLVSNKKKNTESYIEGRNGRKRRKRFCRWTEIGELLRRRASCLSTPWIENIHPYEPEQTSTYVVWSTYILKKNLRPLLFLSAWERTKIIGRFGSLIFHLSSRPDLKYVFAVRCSGSL